VSNYKMFLLAMALMTQTTNLQIVSGKVSFRAVAKPGSMKILGTGKSISGSFLISVKGEVSGFAELDLSSLDTGIELRNRHLKEKYLEVGKFPRSRFSLGPLQIFRDGSNVDTNWKKELPFSGELDLHGVKKRVNGTSTIRRLDNRFEVAAEFQLKLSDFGISIPKFAGMRVENDVTVQVEQQFEMQ
jgi:polyisoprenoid-binding protein YceI